MIGADGLSAVQVTYRAWLRQTARDAGLTTAAVDTMVQHGQIGHWRRGDLVASGAAGAGTVHFVVSGAVQIVCLVPGGASVAAEIVPPGRWFGGSWLDDRAGGCRFVARAHVPAVVARTGPELWRTIVMALPPENVVRLLAYSQARVRRLLLDRCLLLALPLRERLYHVLGTLAADFGRLEPRGTRIDLPLTHADLAALVVATRANVTRGLASLEHDGRIIRDDARAVVVCGPHGDQAAGAA
ncbi:MAG: Crp/Fnr family transcriptional regulator [bacterium]|nr:Crp/Fnr family transcriptional regulator [bacterium]